MPRVAWEAWEADKKKRVLIFGIVVSLLILFLIIHLEVFHIVLANPDVGEGEEYQKIGAIFHNRFRAKHHSPPLKLNATFNELAVECAKYYTQNYRIDHSCPGKRKYNFYKIGENLWHGGNVNLCNYVSAVNATGEWYNESYYYDYDYGDSKTPGKPAGHFVTMIWKSFTELGIGYAAKGTDEVVVAIYYPWNGPRSENVLPP